MVYYNPSCLGIIGEYCLGVHSFMGILDRHYKDLVIKQLGKPTLFSGESLLLVSGRVDI